MSGLARWTARLVGAIPDHVRVELALDPRSAIEAHWDLTVTAAETFAQRGARGWCDGMSITEAGVILYRPTGNRRQNFTLLHELAHNLVDGDDDCIDWVADQPEPARLLEQLCDQIAAGLLLPPGSVDAVLGGARPSAPLWQRLYATTEASWSVCGIALAQRLPCDGFTVIVHQPTGEVMSASRARDTRPYAWPGDVVPAGHPLRLVDPPEVAVAWWPHPNGDRRQYYVSSVRVRDYVYAVFAENDLWEVSRFHRPDTAQSDRGYDGTVNCRNCGYSGRTRWWPHPDCGQPRCPRCGECDCDRRERQTKRENCKDCQLSFPVAQLQGGFCRDCVADRS